MRAQPPPVLAAPDGVDSTSPAGAKSLNPGRNRGPQRARFWLAGVGKAWEKLTTHASPVGGDTIRSALSVVEGPA